MKKFLIVLAAIFITFMSSASAEKNLQMKLSDAIALALKNNRSIEQSEEDRESARLELSAARRKSGPTVSWQSSSTRIGGRMYGDSRAERYRIRAMSEQTREASNINLADYPPYKSSNSNRLMMSMPIYSGGQLEGEIKSARYGLNSADLTLENTRQEVKYQTSQAYYQVLQYKNLMDVRKEAIDLLNEHLRIVQTQYEVGNVAMADVITTRVQIANSEQEYNTSRGNYENAVATLNNLIGLPVDTPLVATDVLNYLPYGQTKIECLDYALNHRPDGIAAAYTVKQAEASVDATKAGFRPNISAVIEGSMTGEGAFKADQTKENWTAGLQLNWNIFDNNVTNAEVAQSKSAQRKAESMARQQLETIRLEVQNAYTNLRVAEENIKVTTDALKEAQEKYSIARIRYEEGEDDNLSVMNAQEKLTEAHTNYFNALYSYNMSKAQLEKAMGLPIEIDAAIYAAVVDDGKSAVKALEDSAVAPSTILDEKGKIKKRSEKDIQEVRKSNSEILTNEPFTENEP